MCKRTPTMRICHVALLCEATKWQGDFPIKKKKKRRRVNIPRMVTPYIFVTRYFSSSSSSIFSFYYNSTLPHHRNVSTGSEERNSNALHVLQDAVLSSYPRVEPRADVQHALGNARKKPRQFFLRAAKSTRRSYQKPFYWCETYIFFNTKSNC